MATGKSGYFDLSGTRGFTVRVYWSETYDIATNTSVITITDFQAKTTNWYGLAYFLNGSVSVGGSAVVSMSSSSGTHVLRLPANLDTFASVTAASGYSAPPWTSGNISHNSDGSGSVTISVSVTGYRSGASSSSTANGNGWTVSASQTITLTTIPRVSTISAGSGTLGVEQTLTVTRQSSSFSHTITYQCGTASGTIATKSTNTSIKWTPPESLAAQSPSESSVTVTLTIETFSGSTSIGTSTTYISCAIPSDEVPSISISTSDPKGHLSKYGGYVQNMSTCKVTVTAAGTQGASIKSYSITCSGQTVSTSSGTFTLPASGNVTITAKVTDSRGRTATATATITVLAYSKPTITSLTSYRCDSAGNFNNKGAYLAVKFSARITSLSNKNTATYTVQYRAVGSSSWSTASNTASGYSPTDVITIISTGTELSYETQVTAKDDFTSATASPGTVLSSFALMILDNVMNRIGIGKEPEGQNILDIGLDTIFRMNVTFEKGMNAVALSENLLNSESALSSALDTIYNGMENYETKLIRFSGYPDESDYTWFGLLFKSSSNYGSMVAHSAFYRGTMITKTKYSGTWQALEWENPPMLAGKEYRTTERWGGAPVYKKRIDHRATKTYGKTEGYTDYNIPHGISNLQTCVNWICKKDSYTFPYPSVAGTTAVKNVDSSNIGLRVAGEWSAGYWYFTLAYTKTT